MSLTFQTLIFALIGLIAGIAITYFVTYRLRAARLEIQHQQLEALRKEAAEAKAAQAIAQGQLELVEAQKRWLDEATAQLTEVFKTLAVDVAHVNSQDFLTLAGQTLGPVNQLMTQVNQAMHAVEKTVAEKSSRLSTNIESLAQMSQQLQAEVGRLSGALKSTKGVGNWGELGLRRVVELAGLTEHCDFDVQVSLKNGQYRLDMLVRLSNGQALVVDAKAPLSAYQEAVIATSDTAQKEALSRHAKNLRKYVGDLEATGYYQHIPDGINLMVAFLPNEAFLSGAVEIDHAIIEDTARRRIILATPTTLIPLLMAVAHGWQERQLSEQTKEIGRLGGELYERFGKLADYLREMRRGLELAVKNYNAAVGSVEGRIYPSVRRLKELGATNAEDIAGLEKGDLPLRDVGGIDK